jgi:DNA polymerase
MAVAREPTLYLDFETRCELDLRRVGAYRYVEHESFDVLLIAAAVNDGDVFVFDPLESPIYLQLVQSLLLIDAFRIVAHNVSFERLVTARWFGARIDDARWDCTAARARMCGLPGDLDGAARACGLPVLKDTRGKRLIRMLCTPRPDGSFNEDPALMREFEAYASRDVMVTRLLDKKLPRLPLYERRNFVYDMTLNDRGVGIDRGLVAAAQDVARDAMTLVNQRLTAVTAGTITTVAQHGRLSTWLTEQGIRHDSLDRRGVRDLLDRTDLAVTTRTALTLRQEGARTSHRKLDTITARSSRDGRLRGMLLYHGAATGRHSSIGVNLQNLPRPERPWPDIVAGIEDLMSGDADFVHRLHGPPLRLIADVLRSVLVPAPGHVFEICDLNAIELRGAAWLSGEQWVLDALTAGEDIYCRMASHVFNRAVTKEDERERFLGKTLELAGQYGMGWQRFRATCAAQDWPVDEALARTGVATYRERHPAIVAAWGRLMQAALEAVREPGSEQVACHVCYAMESGRLACRLPSGRSLIYCQPTLMTDDWGNDCLSYRGVNNVTRQFEEIRLWGALLLEHITQGLCRDVLMEGCWRLESAGHDVVLIVHDEVVCDVWQEKADIALVERLMTTPVGWAPLPLGAKGAVVERYRKL